MNGDVNTKFPEKAGALRTQTEAKGQSGSLAGAGSGSCSAS